MGIKFKRNKFDRRLPVFATRDILWSGKVVKAGQQLLYKESQVRKVENLWRLRWVVNKGQLKRAEPRGFSSFNDEQKEEQDTNNAVNVIAGKVELDDQPKPESKNEDTTERGHESSDQEKTIDRPEEKPASVEESKIEKKNVDKG